MNSHTLTRTITHDHSHSLTNFPTYHNTNSLTLSLSLSSSPPFNSLLKAIRTGKREEASTIAVAASQWLRNIVACGDAGLQGYKKERITPYVHITSTHAPEWNRQLGPLSKFGGEKLERLNDEFKRGHLRQTNGKDMHASILTQKRFEIAKRNESERRQQKILERKSKQGCQGKHNHEVVNY